MRAWEVAPEALAAGWCIEVRHRVVGRDGVERDLPSYWYGPDHGFGTTSGPMGDPSGELWEWFPTRAAAARAKRNAPIAGRRAYQPRRVIEARAELDRRRGVN